MRGHLSSRDLKICADERYDIGMLLKSHKQFVKTIFNSQIKYYGRSEGGTTAVGVSMWHKAEAADVVRSPFTFT